MKNEIIKVSGTKYQLNYSPIEIKTIADAYNEALQIGEIRTIKSYFAEAALLEPELKKDKNAFAELISLFSSKVNQFQRLGATYVFGTHIQSVLLHKAADTVKRINPKVERDLLNFILSENHGKEFVYLQFVPGFIIKIKGARTIEVLFDFRENIRNY